MPSAPAWDHGSLANKTSSTLQVGDCPEVWEAVKNYKGAFLYPQGVGVLTKTPLEKILGTAPSC